MKLLVFNEKNKIVNPLLVIESSMKTYNWINKSTHSSNVHPMPFDRPFNTFSQFFIIFVQKQKKFYFTKLHIFFMWTMKAQRSIKNILHSVYTTSTDKTIDGYLHFSGKSSQKIVYFRITSRMINGRLFNKVEWSSVNFIINCNKVERNCIVVCCERGYTQKYLIIL